MSFSSEQRYTIDGRQVSREEWLASFHDEAARLQAETFEEIKTDVEALTCPTHSESPKVSFTTAGEETRMQIETCCDELEQRAVQVAEGEDD
ncbi:MAG: hypothetical protein WAU75_20485 [Solirubrobacteraceae bacterium]